MGPIATRRKIRVTSAEAHGIDRHYRCCGLAAANKWLWAELSSAAPLGRGMAARDLFGGRRECGQAATQRPHSRREDGGRCGVAAAPAQLAQAPASDRQGASFR